MQNQTFSKLLESRLSERTDKLNATMLTVQGEMAKRGVLQSSIALKAFHECARDELNKRIEVITQTIFDEVQAGDLKPDLEEVMAISRKALKASFNQVEESRRIFAGNIEAGLSNVQIKREFSGIDQFWESKWAELRNAINRWWRTQASHADPTRAEKLKRYWENHPVWAPIIVIIPSLAILVAIITGVISWFK